MKEDEIKYTDKLKGDKGNYGWVARFDLSNGYLGITEWLDDNKIERILLCPAQVEALQEFLRANIACTRRAKVLAQKGKSKSKKVAKPARG